MIRASCIRRWKSRGAVCGDIYRKSLRICPLRTKCDFFENNAVLLLQFLRRAGTMY